jgi:hypothetical protein
VKRPSLWKRLYLKHLCKPVEERPLFAAIAGHTIRQIVEIGLEDCCRAQRLIRIALSCHGEPVTYCGLDWFEAAPEGTASLRIKEAFRKLSGGRGKVKLVPGDPAASLPACANSLLQTNLLVVGRSFDIASRGSVWMYVPRMLAANAQVFVQDAEGRYRLVPSGQIQQLSEQAAGMRRKSA